MTTITHTKVGTPFIPSNGDFDGSDDVGAGGGEDDRLVYDLTSSVKHRGHFGATNALYSLPSPMAPDLFSQTGEDEPIVPHLGHFG